MWRSSGSHTKQGRLPSADLHKQRQPTKIDCLKKLAQLNEKKINENFAEFPRFVINFS
jgi:hypothetical protein